jgi:tRNA (cytidine/uridine-2'-O-)-methyltransferase
MQLALYQPDIPQNTGTILRLAACLSVTVQVIGPAGFDLSDRAFRRAGLDYLPKGAFSLYSSFDTFQEARNKESARRLVLLTTKAAVAYTNFVFSPEDILMVGRESAGVPPAVHDIADARVVIPMAPGTRSLNVAVAAAMVLGEALRQTGEFERLAGMKES